MISVDRTGQGRGSSIQLFRRIRLRFHYQTRHRALGEFFCKHLCRYCHARTAVDIARKMIVEFVHLFPSPKLACVLLTETTRKKIGI
jgi:hypothetical protein